jgi:hypothetical protein
LWITQLYHSKRNDNFEFPRLYSNVLLSFTCTCADHTCLLCIRELSPNLLAMSIHVHINIW